MPDLPTLSTRSDVPSFSVMETMALARRLEAEGRSIIHMEAGEPGLGTPQRAIEAAVRAMENGGTGYTVTPGLPELRERIARLYGEQYGLDIAPSRVLVTIGSSAAFTLAFLACFEAGDRVALGRPGYPAYSRIMQALGLRVAEIQTRLEDRFRPRIGQLEDIGGLSGLLVASPANPTGTMLGADELGALAGWCADKSAWLVSDEVYHRVSYGEAAHSALEFNDEAIVVNSFSKYYCMTGWRLGWMVVPERAAPRLEQLSQNFFLCPSRPAQYAALEVFECTDELDARVGQYARNREILRDGLTDIGFGQIAPPDGAFYVYADASPFTADSVQFCRDMLIEAGVAAVPGSDFDSGAGQTFVRFSTAGTEQDASEAVARLRTWLD